MILVDLQSQMFTPLMPGLEGRTSSRTSSSRRTAAASTPTIVDGQIVYEDREFTTIDEQEVLARANEAFQRVVGRMVVPTEY